MKVFKSGKMDFSAAIVYFLFAKDWSNIISLYQKNSIYLVESASFLQRNAAFELPSVKKQMTRNQQLQQARILIQVRFSTNN
jgi:hypothetical protein